MEYTPPRLGHMSLIPQQLIDAATGDFPAVPLRSAASRDLGRSDCFSLPNNSESPESLGAGELERAAKMHGRGRGRPQ